VRLDTQTVTEQQQVSEQVRKEQIEVDTDGTTGGKRSLVDKAKDALDRDDDGKIGR
jgi:stress response protein YsnF